MLNVALALVLAGDDDGQTVFSVQPVADPAYLVIAALVGMVVLVVGEALLPLSWPGTMTDKPCSLYSRLLTRRIS